jgi:hypothetical protein
MGLGVIPAGDIEVPRQPEYHEHLQPTRGRIRREYVQASTPERATEITGVSADLITKAARLYATTKPAALMTSASPAVQNTNELQNTRAFLALISCRSGFVGVDLELALDDCPPFFLYRSIQ